jgi:hypothetical protein
MKTLRITATLLLTVIAAAACAGSPTGPVVDTEGAQLSLDGQGLLGGGTNAP